MKTLRDFLTEQATDTVHDVASLKAKVKHHSDASDKLAKELVKHNKTSPEYRHIKNDISHHNNASNSYREAHYRASKGWGPSYVKEKVKSAEKHASKVSGKVPEPVKAKEKIRDIHKHVHGLLTGQGFEHSSESHKETTHSIKRLTPYGDDRAFAQRGVRTNTVHTYTKSGTAQEAKHLANSLEKDGVMGTRGNHYVSVHHKGKTIAVQHHVTGKSTPDHSYNEREYNYNTGAQHDPIHWGTRYHAWKRM